MLFGPPFPERSGFLALPDLTIRCLGLLQRWITTRQKVQPGQISTAEVEEGGEGGRAEDGFGYYRVLSMGEDAEGRLLPEWHLNQTDDDVLRAVRLLSFLGGGGLLP